MQRRARGFTLLEILVALAVIALAMGSIIKATSDFTANQSHLHSRTMATWVARNVLVEYQATGQWPRVGDKRGTMDMGNQEWRWLARISQTDEAQLRRIDVDVAPLEADINEPVATLSGFLRQVN